MTRRFHTPKLITGLNPLDARQGKHARDVLRLLEGATVELFDDTGAVAAGVLIYEGNKASVLVDRQDHQLEMSFTPLTVAAAVPKGERADWMVEKLSEIGVAVFIPLAAERSVVIPDGTHKLERWQRIATESAKQSRRKGVMRIEAVAKLESVVKGATICFTTQSEAPSLPDLLKQFSGHERDAITLLIGPEGGWTDREIESLTAKHVKFAQLTSTILRTETAAIAAASICTVLLRGWIGIGFTA